MKKVIFIISLVFVCNHVISQTSEEEILKKKILIDFIEQVYFDYSSPKAEATANIIIKAFRENLIIINPDLTGISSDDALKITSLKFAFQELLNAKPLSWSEIIELEKERLILIDKQIRRKSKYDSDYNDK